jgi:hypothetical protein
MAMATMFEVAAALLEYNVMELCKSIDDLLDEEA